MIVSEEKLLHQHSSAVLQGRKKVRNDISVPALFFRENNQLDRVDCIMIILLLFCVELVSIIRAYDSTQVLQLHTLLLSLPCRLLQCRIWNLCTCEWSIMQIYCPTRFFAISYFELRSLESAKMRRTQSESSRTPFCVFMTLDLTIHLKPNL